MPEERRITDRREYNRRYDKASRIALLRLKERHQEEFRNILVEEMNDLGINPE